MAEVHESLVQGDQAAEWKATNSLSAGRNATWGKQDDFKNSPAAFNAVGLVHKAVESALDVSSRLAKDTSRTPDARHEAAERAVAREAAKIAAAQATLEDEARKAVEQAEEIVAEVFKPDPNKVMLDMMLHQHIHMLATTKENGTQLIREAVNQDKDISRILFTSKSYLLALEPGVLNSLQEHAIRVHAPDAQTLRHNAVALANTAAKYPQNIRSMHASLYSKALSDRAKATRVEV